MAKAKKTKKPPSESPKKIINDARTLEDAKNVYIYDDQNKWTLPELATAFEGVKHCTYSNLRCKCHKENWPEQRRRFQLEVDGQTKEKFIERAANKKSQQAVRNVNRLEVMISLLMQRFSENGKILIDSDYDAARLLAKLIEAQTDIYESVDQNFNTGLKGHRFTLLKERTEGDLN